MGLTQLPVCLDNEGGPNTIVITDTPMRLDFLQSGQETFWSLAVTWAVKSNLVLPREKPYWLALVLV